MPPPPQGRSRMVKCRGGRRLDRYIPKVTVKAGDRIWSSEVVRTDADCVSVYLLSVKSFICLSFSFSLLVDYLSVYLSVTYIRMRQLTAQ